MSDSVNAPDFEAPPTDLITLTRHILAQQQKLGAKASGDLTMLLVGIQVSASGSEHARMRSSELGSGREVCWRAAQSTRALDYQRLLARH